MEEEQQREVINVYKNDNLLSKNLLSMQEIEFRGYYNMWRFVLKDDVAAARERYLGEFIRFYENNFESVNSSLDILSALATVFVGEETALGQYNKVCYAIKKLLLRVH